MADTVRKGAEKGEHFDKPAVLQAKVKEVAALLRNSKHAIVFTGAGISTAAGIPDFRSGLNTVLETGAGLWERKAHERAAKGGKASAADKKAAAKVVKTVDMKHAYPTFTHMSLLKLLEAGVLEHVISQNTDGLHLRSGVPREQLSELHGNRNLERCAKCKAEYLRDHRVRTATKVHDHLTGRKCDDAKCGGALKDSIVNFGESLPGLEFGKAERATARADFCLVLGSSLTVTPAADFPEAVGERVNGDLVIVNLQSTPLDGVASLRVNGKCDDVMRLLMEELGLVVDRWKIRKCVRVEVLGPAAIRSEKISVDAGSVNRGRRATSVASRGRSASGATAGTGRTSARSVARAGSKEKTVSQGSGGGSRENGPRETPTGLEVRVSGVALESGTPYSQFTEVTLVEVPEPRGVRGSAPEPAAQLTGAGANRNRAGTSAAGAASAASGSVVPRGGTSGAKEQRYRLRENETSASFRVSTANSVTPTAQMALGESHRISCAFHGHYREPELELPCVAGVYELVLDVSGTASARGGPLVWEVNRMAGTAGSEGSGSACATGGTTQ
eukprot:gene454-184_t